jgi:tryptophan-rich sensory protein
MDWYVLVPLIAWCTVLFWRVSPVAGALLVPYLAWVAYAATLNVAIALKN